MLGVCLLGEARWPALTLANVLELILSNVPSDARRTYVVGSMDSTVTKVVESLLPRLGVADPHDVCVYSRNVSMIWGAGDRFGGPTEAFDLTFNGKAPCTTAPPNERSIVKPLQLRLNARWVPVFRRCDPSHAYGVSSRRWLPKLPLGMDPNRTWDRFDRARSRPCPSALSQLMQLWQSNQCLQLIQAAEERARGLHHDSILRLRPDIFIFPSFELPRPTARQGNRWYTLFEPTCNIEMGSAQALYGSRKTRFLQDFWMYGSREVMDVALAHPLATLLNQIHKDVKIWRCGSKYLQSGVCNNRTNGRYIPKYYFHPVPYALARHFNESEDCLVAPKLRFGLLRVNVRESCYNVQVRILGTWKELADKQPAPSRHWHAGVGPGYQFLAKQQEQFLTVASMLYRRCFGLEARPACPRTVGDLTLASKGKEAACMRTPWNGSCASFHTDALPTKTLHGIEHTTASQLQGFECVAAGLRLRRATWGTVASENGM